jgi:hypothetical protein
MRIFLILIMLLSLDVSATSIKAEQIALTHANASKYGFAVKNKHEESSQICTTITINKFYKNVEQLGMFIKITSSQGQPVFSSKLTAFPNENNDLVNYGYCYQSYDVVENLITYGYQTNGLITAWFEFSSELIAP